MVGRLVVPPLLIDGDFIFDFQTKAYHFNKLFSYKCITNSTDSFVPPSVNLVTNDQTTINVDRQLISNLILDLNPNKVHGHHELSILMLQMSPDSIFKPLSIQKLSQNWSLRCRMEEG